MPSVSCGPKWYVSLFLPSCFQSVRGIVVYLRLPGVSRVECLVLTNVSADIAVAIFKVGPESEIIP
jgi:hypothetical protein